MAPFWEQPIELWDRMFGSGVRAHYVATALCVMALSGRSLRVEDLAGRYGVDVTG